LPNDSSPAPTVLCLGEVLVDFIADTPGSLLTVPGFRKYPGGAPANVAVGVARLGVSCGFIGKVGDDQFGRFLVDTLQSNGVNTQNLVSTSKAPTAIAFVALSPTKKPDFFFYRNPCADLLLAQEDLPHDWLEQTKLLHIGSVSLTREPSRQATMRAAEIVTRSDAIVTFDPNLRLDLWSNGIKECRQEVLRILPFTDFFLPSMEELLLLMETQDLQEAIHNLVEIGPRVTCIKMGTDGILVVNASSNGAPEKFKQAAFPVEVADTTGAGDAFNAGLITGLVEGLPLKKAVEQGNAVAALAITRKGAMTGLPTRSQLKDFLSAF
jgi:sugar/nucleoside kinase (ribokinase family)